MTCTQCADRNLIKQSRWNKRGDTCGGVTEIAFLFLKVYELHRVITQSGAKWWCALQSRRSSINHVKYLNGGDSANSRDALAKEIYRRLFAWIVDKVYRAYFFVFCIEFY